jgi:hypothetical protein
MISYAEHLGIDLDELETERFTHYRQQKINNQIKIAGAVWANQPVPPKESDWVPIQRAANQLHYHTATIRSWTKAGLVNAYKDKGRVFVYMPDVIRHAGKA